MKGHLIGIGDDYLQPGRPASSASTDSAICAGVYAYGSLGSCPRSGAGKWTLENRRDVPDEIATILNSAVITVLEVAKPRAGPAAKANAQWAKSGFHPKDVRVVGCIVPKEFEDLVHRLCFRGDAEHMRKTCVEALSRPQRMLTPGCRTYLTRFAIGGNFLAYCEDILFNVRLDQKEWAHLLTQIGKEGIAENAILKAEAWLKESEGYAIPGQQREALKKWLLQDEPHYIVGGSFGGKRIWGLWSRIQGLRLWFCVSLRA